MLEPIWAQSESVIKPKIRPSIAEFIKATLASPSVSHFAKFCEVMFERLNPQAVIHFDPGVEDSIAAGNTLILPWPHISLMDVPIIVGAAGLNQEGKALTRAVVAVNPRPFFPPASLGTWWQPEYFERMWKSGISENRFAALGHFISNSIMSGGLLLSKDERSSRNSEMVDEGTEHLINGGNVAMWPSGTFMIDEWRRGAARMVLEYIDRGYEKPLNIVFAHSATYPNSVLKGLVSRSKYPVVVDFRRGPNINDFKQYLDGVNLQDRNQSYAAASRTLNHMVESFKSQKDEFLTKVTCAISDCNEPQFFDGVELCPDPRLQRINRVYSLLDGRAEP